MMRRLTLIFIALFASLGAFAQIVGPSSICLGTTATYMDSAMVAGTWSSSNPTIGAITTSSSWTAVVTGVTAGTTALTFTAGSTVDVKVITVNPTPSAIVGGGVTICSSATLALSDPTPGGVWTVSGPATINATTGLLTAGTTTGVATVHYALGSCSVSTTVTINAASADSISGAGAVCVGSSISLSATAAGGTWSSSAPGIATVSGGLVTGVTSGIAIISHTTSGSCGTYVATHAVTVTSTGTAGTISGPASIAIGGSGSLSSTVSGGVWSSSNPTLATVSTSGVVHGVAAGSVILSYAVAGCGGTTVYATYVVTVTTPDGISGYVHYSGWSNVKVWLIKYDPSGMMLSAVDSVHISGTDSAYYAFLSLPADSYRVKAALDSGAFLGFVPTYHTSSFYWNTATVINHTAGAWDAHKDINMIAGTPVTGSGFIGGSVITGANKGTADGAPVAGMNMFLLNAATHAVLKYTTTDASGNYTFTGLPVGIYDVFPEELGYATTQYSSISLTASAPSMNTAKFMQRTVSKKITPIGTVAVNELDGTNTSISAFPNPTSGKLNINWSAATSEEATLIITDVTGREVLTKSFSMTKGNGAEVVNLSSFVNGMYFVSVKAASAIYINKIEVRH